MQRQLFQYAVLLLLLLSTTDTMAIEEPEYTVLISKDGVEYRQYAPYLVAETMIAAETDRNAAASQGFRRLFRYISGDNMPNTSVSMTAPVQQTPGPNGWKVAFVVPAEFTQQTAPVPADPAVAIHAVPAQLLAVIRYSGRWTDKNIKQRSDELLEKLAADGIKTTGEVMSAAYNAPFTPPFMRRNEVMVVVDRVPAN